MHAISLILDFFAGVYPLHRHISRAHQAPRHLLQRIDVYLTQCISHISHFFILSHFIRRYFSQVNHLNRPIVQPAARLLKTYSLQQRKQVQPYCFLHTCTSYVIQKFRFLLYDLHKIITRNRPIRYHFVTFIFIAQFSSVVICRRFTVEKKPNSRI